MQQLDCLGTDYNGITDISLEALRQFKDKELIAVKVHGGDNTMDIMCSFIFGDDTFYQASGFSVGYGGTGPHGLYRAIQVFHPDAFESFDASQIACLSPKCNWSWTPKYGFEETV